MPLIRSLSTTTLSSYLTPVRAGGVVSSYVSATTFFVDSTTGISIGDKFKATGGADRYGTVSDISGVTITAENISDSAGVTQQLHTLMSKIFIGYNSDITSPVNSPQVVGSKATAKRLKVKSGRVIRVLGTDGGTFYAITGAAALTYGDDDVSFCGTRFVPNGGDGSTVWLRYYSGDVDVAWFGAKVDGVTNDTAAVNSCVTFCNINNKVLKASPGTCLITPGGILVDVTCSVDAPHTTFKAATSANLPIFSIAYSEAANSAGRVFKVGIIQGFVTGTSGTATGLHIKHSDYSQFIIRQIHSLAVGMRLDGLITNSRIARNEFVIGKIYTCTDGLLVTSGIATSYITELNTFNINSIHNCSGNLIHIFNSSVNVIDENVFNINALEINVINAVGIRVSTVGQRNIFNVSGILTGETGTGKLIIAAGLDNIFNIPVVDFARITDTTNLNKYYSRFSSSQSFTATFTGFTTTPTTLCHVDRSGNAVTVRLTSSSATSNSTSFTITGLPTWAQPSLIQFFSLLVFDNGVTVTGWLRIGTDGVITFYVGPALGSFTASGQKGFSSLSFTYLLN